MKHQVIVARGAKVTLDGKSVGLKNFKTRTMITAYHVCATKGPQFQANKICECASPRPQSKKE
jgi:hypothetical protein